MQTKTAQTFLDIFVIVNNSSLMPEVFTMIVNGDSPSQYPPNFPSDLRYKGLPIGGVPSVIDKNISQSNPSIANGYLTPSIFYLEDGIMLFFRVPLTDESMERLFTDNYFGPNDYNNGGELPMMFL
jgi:hypothetical protein